MYQLEARSLVQSKFVNKGREEHVGFLPCYIFHRHIWEAQEPSHFETDPLKHHCSDTTDVPFAISYIIT